MYCYEQQCKQPCLLPPITQQNTGIKSTKGYQPQNQHRSMPPFPSQRQDSCPPGYLQSPYTPQSPQNYAPEYTQPCSPQSQPCYVPESTQSCSPQTYGTPSIPVCCPQGQKVAPAQYIQPCSPPQQKSLSYSQGAQQTCCPLCKSPTLSGQQPCTTQITQPCAPKGRGQWVSQQSTGQCSSQSSFMKGGSGYASEGHQQWSSQQGVAKGGPVCSPKSSQQLSRKGSQSFGPQQCKTQVKISSRGKKYCSAGKWPF